MPEPRIERDIAKIDGEIDADENHREQKHDALDQRQVTADHRVDRQIAEAFIREQPFDDNGAADEKSELDAGQGERRRQHGQPERRGGGHGHGWSDAGLTRPDRSQ